MAINVRFKTRLFDTCPEDDYGDGYFTVDQWNDYCRVWVHGSIVLLWDGVWFLHRGAKHLSESEKTARFELLLKFLERAFASVLKQKHQPDLSSFNRKNKESFKSWIMRIIKEYRRVRRHVWQLNINDHSVIKEKQKDFSCIHLGMWDTEMTYESVLFDNFAALVWQSPEFANYEYPWPMDPMLHEPECVLSDLVYKGPEPRPSPDRKRPELFIDLADGSATFKGKPLDLTQNQLKILAAVKRLMNGGEFNQDFREELILRESGLQTDMRIRDIFKSRPTEFKKLFRGPEQRKYRPRFF